MQSVLEGGVNPVGTTLPSYPAGHEAVWQAWSTQDIGEQNACASVELFLIVLIAKSEALNSSWANDSIIHLVADPIGL